MGTVFLTQISLSTFVLADNKKCKTDEDSSWVCKGDQAFSDGYIVSGEVLKDLIEKEELLERVKSERDEYRSLSETLSQQRDEYKAQRDSLRELIDWSNSLREEYKSQRDSTLEEVSQWESKFYVLRERVQELEEKEQRNWTTWEVGALSGGVALAGILAGIGLGYVISL